MRADGQRDVIYRPIRRRLFTARVGPDLCSAAVIQPVMTTVGVFTFLAGALYLPALAPTRVELIVVLLLLGAVAMLCHLVGQLAVIIERLGAARQGDKRVPAVAPNAEPAPGATRSR